MIDGALLLDKPVGVTSNRALQEAKRLLHAKKAGHAGTLDPLASGLLVLLFGEATKFAAALLDADKEYVATLKLGSRTSTGDAEGAVLEERPVAASADDVAAVLERFRGVIDQVPPMHSALKRDGVPLYKLAREGKTVERAPRRVRITQLEAIKVSLPYVELRVGCAGYMSVTMRGRRALPFPHLSRATASIRPTRHRFELGDPRLDCLAPVAAVAAERHRRDAAEARLLVDPGGRDAEQPRHLGRGQELRTVLRGGACEGLRPSLI